MDALADIDALVEVGRRAPGSDAERRAARYLERRLADLGRDAEIEPVDAWPNWAPAYACLALLGAAGSVLSVSLPAPGAAMALAAALLLFLDAGLMWPVARRAFGRRASQNVVSWDDQSRPGILILVAHYDAGRGGLVHSARARERVAALGRLIHRPLGGLELLFWAHVAVLACCLVRLAGVGGTALTALQFVPTVALVVAVALLVDVALAGTKGGENDNASGVVLALRLAERFAGRLDHFGVQVLLTGSQKAMCAGMRGFLGAHRAELERRRTVVLNLDEVGSGTARHTRREGPLLAARAHVQLLSLCERIDPDEQNASGARGIVSRSPSDAYAARVAGLPAVTVTCRDRPGYAGARVDEGAIEDAEALCAELIELLDAHLGPELAARAEDAAFSEAESP